MQPGHQSPAHQPAHDDKYTAVLNMFTTADVDTDLVVVKNAACCCKVSHLKALETLFLAQATSYCPRSRPWTWTWKVTARLLDSHTPAVVALHV